MVIEFQTPINSVPEKLLEGLKKVLTQFHNKDKEIKRAEVYLLDTAERDRLCRIELTVFENSIVAQGHAKSYERAIDKVVNILSRKVQEQVSNAHELPEKVLSTVNI